jgi:hypothetical protein
LRDAKAGRQRDAIERQLFAAGAAERERRDRGDDERAHDQRR